MNYNGKSIETLNLTSKNEINISGSISKLKEHVNSAYRPTCDTINIFPVSSDDYFSNYTNFKSLIKFMKDDNYNHSYIKIKLLVKDELKILSLIETLNISLLEAIYMVYIQDKEVEWIPYES